MESKTLFARPAFTGSNIADIKSHNLRAVLKTFLHERSVSRVRLARLTGLSNTTITNLVAELLEQGIVVAEDRGPTQNNGVGRPRTPLRLVPSARYAVGVHIGVGNIRVAVADLFGQLQNCLVISHASHDPAGDVLERVAQLIDQAIIDAGVNRARLVGIGVGASGLVDPQSGLNILAPNLGWRNLPIGATLSRQLNLPVFVDNNVRAMALAEAMFGAARHIQSLAFVYARSGVGAGFVVEGRVYRGSRAGAGEIGHTTIIPAAGAPCRCGNTGCLETLVSEPEIIRQAEILALCAPGSILACKLAEPAGPVIERIFEAARAGDKNTLDMLKERAHYMGIALANLVNTMNPDMIIMGGLFAAGHDLLLAQVEETMRRRAFAGLADHVILTISSFGPRAGAIGAVALALDTFFYQQQTQQPATQVRPAS